MASQKNHKTNSDKTASSGATAAAGSKMDDSDDTTAVVDGDDKEPNLRNVIERASILEDGELVTLFRLPADMIGDQNGLHKQSSTVILPPDGIPLETVELELARQALERTKGNLTRAAKLLDISRDQLRYKLKKSVVFSDDANGVDEPLSS